MGLFDKLFKSNIEKKAFVPDLNKTEYDNWLDYLESGGTSDEWKKLIKENKWKFKKDSVEKFDAYEKKFRPLWDKYYNSALSIKSTWSVMYNEKTYTGKIAEQFEKDCMKNISDYKNMYNLEEKYKKKHMISAEGYKRLAMLYEKQGRFEEAVKICEEACSLGLKEDSRLERMQKKQAKKQNI